MQKKDYDFLDVRKIINREYFTPFPFYDII